MELSKHVLQEDILYTYSAETNRGIMAPVKHEKKSHAVRIQRSYEG